MNKRRENEHTATEVRRGTVSMKNRFLYVQPTPLIQIKLQLCILVRSALGLSKENKSLHYNETQMRARLQTASHSKNKKPTSRTIMSPTSQAQA